MIVSLNIHFGVYRGGVKGVIVVLAFLKSINSNWYCVRVSCKLAIAT